MQNQKNEAGNLLPKAFVFNATNQTIRVEFIESEPWFICRDILNVLGIGKDTGDALQRLDDDEKLTRLITDSGQGRQMWLVNESGLYNLIFQSRKPEAKAFRKWVTSEVLPSIRRSGKYELTGYSSGYSPRTGNYLDLRN